VPKRSLSVVLFAALAAPAACLGGDPADQEREELRKQVAALRRELQQARREAEANRAEAVKLKAAAEAEKRRADGYLEQARAWEAKLRKELGDAIGALGRSRYDPGRQHSVANPDLRTAHAALGRAWAELQKLADQLREETHAQTARERDAARAELRATREALEALKREKEELEKRREKVRPR
jgi:hypothetical protein